MSYTNGTTHYNLPLTTGADKRDWSDTNQAFSDVDAALYGAVQDTAQAELDIDALETRMDTAEQNISTNTGNISGLDARLTTAEGAITSQAAQITDTRQDLEDMICAFNEASATSTHTYAIGDYFIYNDVLYKATQAIAIGDTIVPDTNCATTNVTTELLATEDLSGDVQQLQTDVGQLQTDVTELEQSEVTIIADATSDTYSSILDKISTFIMSQSYSIDKLSKSKIRFYKPLPGGGADVREAFFTSFNTINGAFTGIFELSMNLVNLGSPINIIFLTLVKSSPDNYSMLTTLVHDTNPSVQNINTIVEGYTKVSIVI